MVKRTLLGLLLALGLFAVSAGTTLGGASTASSQPFFATGTVSNNAAPIDPTPVEGSNVAFILSPVTTSPNAQAYLDASNPQMTIYGTPLTNYYRSVNGAPYMRSNYSATVTVGASLYVTGHYYATENGVRFIADTVDNPPPPPPSGSGTTGTAPCRQQPGLTFHTFYLGGTIAYNRVHVPCTGFGGVPDGMNIGSIAYFSNNLSSAVAPGNVDVYTGPLTQYYDGGQPSDFAHVVVLGYTLTISGFYTYAGGVYYLEATKVAHVTTLTPPSPNTTPVSVDTDIQAALTDGAGHYRGTSAGPSLALAQFDAGLTCLAGSSGTTISGPWQIFDGGGNSINGTLSGSVTSSGYLSVTMTATGGTGTFNNASGSGTMTGEATPPPPTTACGAAFYGHISMNVIP